jgi:transcriptional regulator of acetoin/glycerol metabolism
MLCVAENAEATRSQIRTRPNQMPALLVGKQSVILNAQPFRGTTLETVERDHILKILSATKWVIGGPTGAAARLGMNRTTLNHRLRKLGITRPQPQL